MPEDEFVERLQAITEIEIHRHQCGSPEFVRQWAATRQLERMIDDVQ